MGGNIFAKKKRPEEVLEVQPQFSAKRSSIITTGY
jgi:hypothetical protein